MLSFFFFLFASSFLSLLLLRCVETDYLFYFLFVVACKIVGCGVLISFGVAFHETTQPEEKKIEKKQTTWCAYDRQPWRILLPCSSAISCVFQRTIR